MFPSSGGVAKVTKAELYKKEAFAASCSKSDTMRWQFRLPAYSCGFEQTR
ncbi:hypothetical protein [Agathobacter rectalis]|nr:hypothetical protein [Agathobacter rectalis]